MKYKVTQDLNFPSIKDMGFKEAKKDDIIVVPDGKNVYLEKKSEPYSDITQFIPLDISALFIRVNPDIFKKC